jgi:mannose-6-phosphate isomerase
MPVAPFVLAPWFSSRPWGTRDLSAWYPSHAPASADSIGEAWLTGNECRVLTGTFAGLSLAGIMAASGPEILGPAVPANAIDPEFPLLLKFIFPQEKLSVQVHPDDVLAQSLGHPRGKTECWYVLEAAPGATIALGLRPGVTKQNVERAMANSTLESLLNQVPVAAGDMVFVDAGTIHAIGPGIVLFETQQQSDLTYRLHDYDRGRELHLELGLRALRVATEAGKVVPSQIDTIRTNLISNDFFSVERLSLAANNAQQLAGVSSIQILVPLTAGISLQSYGSAPLTIPKAHACVIPANATGFDLIATGEAVVLRATPGSAV